VKKYLIHYVQTIVSQCKQIIQYMYHVKLIENKACVQSVKLVFLLTNMKYKLY